MSGMKCPACGVDQSSHEDFAELGDSFRCGCGVMLVVEYDELEVDEDGDYVEIWSCELEETK